MIEELIEVSVACPSPLGEVLVRPLRPLSQVKALLIGGHSEAICLAFGWLEMRFWRNILNT